MQHFQFRQSQDSECASKAKIVNVHQTGGDVMVTEEKNNAWFMIAIVNKATIKVHPD